MRDEVLHPHAEQDRDVEILVDRGRERGLQVAAMDDPIGGAVALFGDFAERHAHDFAPARGVEHPQRRGCDDMRAQPVAEAELDQYARRVRRELNSRAGLFEPFGLLQHDDAEAVARQSERRCKAADAGAGDDDCAR